MIVARHILRAARLCAAVHALWSREIPRERACAASVAITLTAGREDPALIAAIAYRESRFVATAHNPRTLAAGPLGVVGFDVRRGELAGYVAGVRVLRAARAWCVRRGTPGALCEVAVYCSGPNGASRRLYRGPRVVLHHRAALLRSMGAQHVGTGERS